MSYIYYIGNYMKHHLYFSKQDSNYSMLKKYLILSVLEKVDK